MSPNEVLADNKPPSHVVSNSFRLQKAAVQPVSPTKATWGAIGAALLAFGLGLVDFSESPDSWARINQPYPMQKLIGEGRPLFYVTDQLFNYFGIEAGLSRFVTLGAAITLYAISINLVVNIWFRGEPTLTTLVLTSVAVVLPYATDLFVFHEASIYLCLGYFFASLAAVHLLSSKKSNWWLTGSLTLFIALCFYQASMTFTMVAIVFYALLELLEHEPTSATLKRAGLATLCVAATAVLQTISTRLLMLPLGVKPNDRRYGLIEPGDISHRISEVSEAIRTILFREEVFFHQSTKIVIAIGVASMLMVSLVRSRPGRFRGRLIALWLVGAVLSLGLLLGLNLFVKNFALPARSLSHAGLVLVGLISVCLASARDDSAARPRCEDEDVFGSKLDAFVVLWALIVIFSSAGTANSLLVNQHRQTTRDLFTANRLIAAYEPQIAAGEINEIVLSRSFSDLHPGQLIEPAGQNSVVTAFRTPRGTLGAITEVSGYRLSSRPNRRDLATELCKGKPRWPEEGSQIVRGTTLYVCVYPPTRD